MGKLTTPNDRANARQQRADNYVNLVNGLGDPNKDRTQAARHVTTPRRADAYYEGLFETNALAHRIASLPASESLRQGFCLELGPDVDTDGRAHLMKDFDRLEGCSVIVEAMALARATGGAVVLIGANDGQADLSQPLNLDRVREVVFLKSVSKRYVFPVPGAIGRDFTKPDFGKVTVYTVQLMDQLGETSTIQVHASRLLRFDGIVTTPNSRAQNLGWGDSVYRQVEESLKLFEGSVQGLANALSDADQAVFKIDGLMDIIKGSDEGDDAIRKRLSLLNHGRSVARAIAIDAERENFSYEARTFQGYDSGIFALMYVLSSATGIPVTLLFGRAPAGLNATGDSDVRFFYDTIKQFQETRLLPQLHRLFEILMAAKLGPLKGVRPDASDWSISFRSLWQPTAVERADIRLKNSQADEIDIANNVLSSQEIRDSRYGGDEYNTEISIDESFDPSENVGGDLLSNDPQSLVSGTQTNVQQQALNGAQVASLVDVVTKVAGGLLPRDAAKNIIQEAFQVNSEEAEKMLGPAGRSFSIPVEQVPLSGVKPRSR